VRQWACALSAAAIAVSAGATTSSAAAPASPTKVVLAKYGFSLTLPPGWQQVHLTTAGIAKIVKYLSKADPKLVSLVASPAAQATIRKLQLYAIGPPGGGTLPNVNVLVQSPQGLPSGADFLSQAKPQMASLLQSQGFTHVSVSVAHLRLGSAVEGQYSVPGTPEGAITQLYISHRSHLYIVTFSSPSVAAQIENTWHWL
jgi:hypothetical protein